MDQALEELPEELRTLLVAHFLQGRPQNELAAMLAAYNFIGVAVCNTGGRLLGAVTVDDVLDRLLPVGWRRIGGR